MSWLRIGVVIVPGYVDDIAVVQADHLGRGEARLVTPLC
jgi:hypothetical protein